MSLDELMTDIRATFPEIKLMLREHCLTEKQVWMFAADEGAKMPDGLPIFSQLIYEEGTYDDGVHVAFTSWIENRGFYLENHDGFWRHPVHLPTADEIAAWHAAYAIGSAQRSAMSGVGPDDDGLPF